MLIELKNKVFKLKMVRFEDDIFCYFECFCMLVEMIFTILELLRLALVNFINLYYILKLLKLEIACAPANKLIQEIFEF